MSSNSGSLILGAVGAVVGGFFGGPAGAQAGWLIGSGVGSLLFPQQVEGPRLDDLKVQVSSYGAPIPIIYGSMRVAGNVIWATDLQEVSETESAKGGPEITTYSYLANCAVLVCEGPVFGIRRIWANKRLVADYTTEADQPLAPELEGMAGNFGDGVDTQATSGPRIYLGTETQTADPAIVADKGTSPAYRGWSYVVFEGYDTTLKDGSRLPQFEFEVLTEGTFSLAQPEAFGFGDVYVTTDPGTGLIWAVDNDAGVIRVYSPEGYSLVDTVVLDAASSFGSAQVRPTHVEFVTTTGTAWIGNGSGPTGSGTRFWVLDAATRTVVHRHDEPGANFRRMTFDAVTLEVIGWTQSPTPNGRVIDITSYAQVATIAAGFPSQPTSALYCADASPADDLIVVTVTGGQGFVFDAASKSLLTSVADVGRFITFDGTRNLVYGITGNVLRSFSLETYALTVVHTFPSGAGGADVIYSATLDRIIVSDDTDMHLVHPDTGAIEATFDGQPRGYSSLALSGTTTLIGSTDPTSGAGDVYRIPMAGQLDRLPVVLSDIVSDISTRAGLVAGDMSYAALTDEVPGYVIGQQMPARGAIEALQPVYFFDIVESDDKLKAVKRGGAIAATIPADDRAATEDASAADAVRIVRAMEQEIPEQVEVNYADYDADYLIGSQYERRITRYSDGTLTRDLPLALTADKGKAVAIVGLYSTWLRQRYSWVTSRVYAHLEPTDVVSLPTPAATYNARIVSKRERAQGLIEWEAIEEDSALYSATGEPGAGGYVPQTIRRLDLTDLQLMDIPLMRDEDDDPGFYAAAAGAGSGDWPGTRVFRSSDEGATYAEMFALVSAATIGAASTALGDFLGGNIFDELSTVTVRLTSGTLTSATELQVLNGANAALLGDEIIQFKTATLIDTDTYRLSGFLRGRRGTERVMDEHAIGDTFVLASESTWRRVTGPTADIGLERLYKAPTIGRRLTDTAAEAFTNTAVGLECYAPVQLGGGRNAALDVTLTWVRRTRIGGEWRDSVDVSLGEASESYEVEVWDAGFVALMRTITGLASPTTVYTAAQQTTDFGAAQSMVYFKVFQLSATVGRGFEARGQV